MGRCHELRAWHWQPSSSSRSRRVRAATSFDQHCKSIQSYYCYISLYIVYYLYPYIYVCHYMYTSYNTILKKPCLLSQLCDALSLLLKKCLIVFVLLHRPRLIGHPALEMHEVLRDLPRKSKQQTSSIKFSYFQSFILTYIYTIIYCMTLSETLAALAARYYSDSVVLHCLRKLRNAFPDYGNCRNVRGLVRECRP